MATVVLLGHVNKHKGADGQDIYEGTGDLQNDCDNLLFLVPTKDGDSLLVSTKCDPPAGVGKMLTLPCDAVTRMPARQAPADGGGTACRRSAQVIPART